MSADDPRERWNERYRDADPPTEPTPLVEQYRDRLEGETALDVATGGGRNAIALAEDGFAVEAIDVAEAGLEIARERAAERGVDVEFVRADAEAHSFGVDRYDVISVSHYYSLETLAKATRALAPGGTLLYEHDLRSPGDETDRFGFYPNDLLRSSLDLRIVRYVEPFRLDDEETGVRLVARKPSAVDDESIGQGG
ncbi:class I SAM-dependent methyltransferase [Natrarchaeobius sp. A-rgal3]|uniref:class I SAM-dependent methyltransferase n=1 Tax=Natrarchaeobius versutus TaxID=1679078 RepID=UPI00350ED51D